MAEHKQILFINIDEKVSPAVLAGLLNRNISLIYQWAQIGRLPDIKNGSFTYRECIDHIVTTLLFKAEAKILKVQEEARLKEIAIEKNNKAGREVNTNISIDDGSIHPLVAAKLKQNIKTEIAREADLWQKIAIKRGEYVAFGDKLDLVEDCVLSIRDTLLHIGNNYPDIQVRIDEAMEELFQLGKLLVEDAKIDADNFIETMLAKEIELTNDDNEKDIL